MPLEKQEFLVTAIGMRRLGPSPAHAGSGTGFLELFVISAWGLIGEGSAWLGATSPIAGNEVLGEETSGVPLAPVCSAKSQAKQGCGGLRSPCLLPTSPAASPRSVPTTSPHFPEKQ